MTTSQPDVTKVEPTDVRDDSTTVAAESDSDDTANGSVVHECDHTDEGIAWSRIMHTVTIGRDAPTATRSTVLVTLDEMGGRWLVSDFQPK